MTQDKPMRIGALVKIPMTPNFLLTPESACIPIEDMSDKDLREIGKRWTRALLTKARNKRGADAKP